MHEQPGLPSQSLGGSFGNSNPQQSKLDGVFQLLNNVIRTTRDFIVKDNFTVDDLEVKILCGLRFNRRTFSTLASGSVYSVTRMDYCIGITNLSYAPSIGLPSPSAAGSGKTYLIKDEAGGAGTTTITIRSTGDATIDGASTATIAVAYGSKMLYTDGNAWYVGLS